MKKGLCIVMGGGRRKKRLDFIIFLLCLQSYKEIKKYKKTLEYRSLFPMDIWFWYTYFKIVTNIQKEVSW